MDIEAKVFSIIENNIEKKQEIALNSKLIEDLGIDSFGMLMVITALEEEFLITIKEEDFAKIKTVSDIVLKLKGT